MSAINTINPNILYPTQSAFIAGSPGESAYKQMQLNDAKQNDLNLSFKGGKEKNKGGGYEAPQFVMPYNTNGTNPNAVIAGNTQISVQGGENSKYDYLAFQKGGNPNWNWGCYNGGKKKKTHKKKTHKKKTHKKKTHAKNNYKKKTHKRTINKRKIYKKN